MTASLATIRFCGSAHHPGWLLFRTNTDHQFINVQGDQPFLDPAVIEAMVAEFSRRSPTPELLTPVFRMCGM